MAGPIEKIDITPLVGVALILVIVFMTTSPLMMVPLNLEIDLPKARTIEAKSESNITISITRDNIIALNETEIQLANLQVALSAMLQEHPERLVVIRADKNVNHQWVLDLLTISKRAGATRLAVATLQRNREKL
jgi:biopolymer transport protein ExbD